jgi:hypothetical protein
LRAGTTALPGSRKLSGVGGTGNTGNTGNTGGAAGADAAPKPAPADDSSPSAVTRELSEALTRIRTEERKLDRFLRRARWGADFELSELVAMQSLVYRYTRQVELLSKLVERVTGAVKQTLRTRI